MNTITTNALIKRINRALARHEQFLKKVRGQQARAEHGDFVILDGRRSRLLSAHVDLGKFGRDLGALREDERVATSQT